MSIGIITYHRAINYGAILQVYALQKYLHENFDDEVYVIDYLSNKIKNDYSTKLNIKTITKKFLVGRYETRTKNKFDLFLSNQLNLSRPYNEETISTASDLYDLYFTGSDQVWNYKGNDFDTNYFLSFVSDVRKRNSYAASIGMASIPSEYIPFYKSNLIGMNNISVREKSAQKIICDLNLNKKVQVVLDPTLLLKDKEWSNLIGSGKIIKVEKPYILIYSFSLSDDLYKFALDLSDKTGLPIYTITNSPKKWKRINNLYSVGPLDFLDLFKNADYVLTNSFHGTAFSINFNKVFWVDLSTSVNKAVTSRITDLLDELDIQDRTKLSCYNMSIDYDKVNQRLEAMRKQSKNYLCKVCFNE